MEGWMEKGGIDGGMEGWRIDEWMDADIASCVGLRRWITGLEYKFNFQITFFPNRLHKGSPIFLLETQGFGISASVNGKETGVGCGRAQSCVLGLFLALHLGITPCGVQGTLWNV